MDEHYGLPEKYIRIFQAFFNGTMSAVRVNGELTDWFTVNSVTGQGDIQGPPVFNFCLNFAAYMAETNKTASRDVRIQWALGKWSISSTREDLEQQSYKDPDQDPYIQGGCYLNPVIWIRSLEYHKEADEEI